MAEDMLTPDERAELKKVDWGKRGDPWAEPQVTSTEAAALAGVAPDTWSSYVSRGQAPAPDGRLGRTPWWWESTVQDWVAQRPRAAGGDHAR